MAVTSLKNKIKRGSLLVGNTAYDPTDFDSIATVTVGAGGSSSIDFNSISGTYKHLQIRGIARATGLTYGKMNFNSDTTSSYSYHALYGTGASASADAGATKTFAYPFDAVPSGTDIFGGFVIDILDYANTNKYKTTRALSGSDSNGSGYVYFTSSSWQKTDAITSISLTLGSGGNFQQYSHFALYGVN